MGYVYISMRRTDIPAGAIQVLDLQPNSSQRNTSIDPPGQTKYVIRLQNDPLAALNANRTVAAYQGVAAYLIDHVINDVGGRTITVAQANTAALAIVAAVNAGTDLTLEAVNVILDVAGAGTVLTGNGSSGVLADLLKIIAGASYTLPSGSLVGNLVVGADLGSFAAGQYRNTYNTGAFQISFGEGHLSQYCSDAFSYDDVPGAALVCYASDGSVYTL